MRILFAADVPRDPDSGAAGTEFRTIEALRRRGHEVDAIWEGDMKRRISHGNLHYLLELPRAYREIIARYSANRAYDVVHVNQGHCYLAARDHAERGRHGVFVCRSHGLDDHMERELAPWRERLGLGHRSLLKAAASGMLNRLLKRHDRLAYRYSSGVLVSSSLDRRYLVDDMKVPADRVAAVAQAPAAVFTATPAPVMNLVRLRKILHVGGFAYWKGVHALAEALNHMTLACVDFQMTWVCRAEEQEQVAALLDPLTRQRIVMRSWVGQAELVDIFDQHGIFICPSLFEGFGKVFIEAMARGLCVIGTPAGGMNDIINPDVNGCLVGFNDARGIADKARQLMEQPALAGRMSRQAAADAREYSWDRVARETENFYERLQALDAGPRS